MGLVVEGFLLALLIYEPMVHHFDIFYLFVSYVFLCFFYVKDKIVVLISKFHKTDSTLGIYFILAILRSLLNSDLCMVRRLE